jgi:hypothetical protein
MPNQMNPSKILLTICLLFFCLQSKAQEIWTVGPMMQINFGGEKKWSVSYALEGAYWNADAFPYSIDMGLEFEKGKFRIYSEAQTGIGLTGISVGPVLQLGKNGIKLGLQTTFWVNYILGLDYRIRFIEKTRYHCAGLYVKLPVETSGLDSGSSGSYDFDGWD